MIFKYSFQSKSCHDSMTYSAFGSNLELQNNEGIKVKCKNVLTNIKIASSGS